MWFLHAPKFAPVMMRSAAGVTVSHQKYTCYYEHWHQWWHEASWRPWQMLPSFPPDSDCNSPEYPSCLLLLNAVWQSHRIKHPVITAQSNTVLCLLFYSHAHCLVVLQWLMTSIVAYALQ